MKENIIENKDTNWSMKKKATKVTKEVYINWLPNRVAKINEKEVEIISKQLWQLKIYYINTEFGRRLDPFLEEHVPFGKGLTPAICSCMAVFVSRHERVTLIKFLLP